MSADIEAEVESSTPIWAAFGDLMSVLLGVFVLILVGVIDSTSASMSALMRLPFQRMPVDPTTAADPR